MNDKEKTIWCAHTLFSKGLVSSSTGNISFRENDIIYISQSGSCFGLLDEHSFAQLSLNGDIIAGKPSKEWPMHLKLYRENPEIVSVIHTHSFYSTKLSCIKDLENMKDQLFKYTPYLQMQTSGRIGIVEYGKPGSEELFHHFYEKVNKDTNVYILKNHGVFIAHTDPLKSFYLLEEFETSSRLLCEIEKDLIYSGIENQLQ